MDRKKDTEKKNSKVSRGYCGYYKGKWYLRSLREYKMACYLDMLQEKFSHVMVQYEPNYQTYVINNRAYKPDFYVFKFNRLTHIIEVKSSRVEAEKYQQMFRSHFQKLGIQYIIVWSDREFRLIEQKTKLTPDDINSWIESSIYDYSGENNPRYGVMCSDETKKKIGKKTAERNKDADYKRYFSEQVKKAMNDDVRKKISIARKRIVNRENPMIDYQCPHCGQVSHLRSTKANNRAANHQGCSYNCTVQIRIKKGLWKPPLTGKKLDGLPTRLQNDILKAGLSNQTVSDWLIKQAKQEKKLPMTSPLSEKSLMKYFNTLNTEEIISGKDKEN